MAIDLNMNVLVVDDHESMLRAIRCVLNAIGFKNVGTVNNVEDAMRRLTGDEKTYSLIVSDYRMEPHDGLDFLRQVRSTPALKDIKFVMMTAEADLGFSARVMEAGANDFIIKPFSATMLASKLQDVFDD